MKNVVLLNMIKIPDDCNIRAIGDWSDFVPVLSMISSIFLIRCRR